VDQAELDKLPAKWEKHRIDLRWNIDAEWLYLSDDSKLISNPLWLKWCKDLYNRFRPELDGSSEFSEFVDPYHFVDVLSHVIPADTILVPGSSGMQSCAIMQAWKVKEGQRILLCNTSGAMGMEPMVIGAAIQSGKPVVCVTGDGGFALNIQELEVVRREKLSIKYFVFCNGGYASVASMQDNRMKRRVGADAGSGFTVPNYKKVAFGFGIPFSCLRGNEDCNDRRLRSILKRDEPMIITVPSSMEFKYPVKMGSSLKDNHFILDPMERMTPYLPDSELEELMNWGGNE
jgi:acetolactate synthase-1/2/3 large subunit